MLPTTHRPVLMPTPIRIGMNVPLQRPPHFFALAVEPFDTIKHIERRFAGVEFVRGIVERCVQNAMIASPMYLSMVPRRSMMALVSGVRSCSSAPSTPADRLCRFPKSW